MGKRRLGKRTRSTRRADRRRTLSTHPRLGLLRLGQLSRHWSATTTFAICLPGLCYPHLHTHSAGISLETSYWERHAGNGLHNDGGNIPSMIKTDTYDHRTASRERTCRERTGRKPGREDALIESVLGNTSYLIGDVSESGNQDSCS